MKFGAHVSVRGGVELAPDRAVEIGCETFQIFTRNQRQWQARPLPPQAVEQFREKCIRYGLKPLCAHASYLINLASPDPATLERSRQAMVEELERAQVLGIEYVVVHSGAHMGHGIPKGLEALADSVMWVLDRVGGTKTARLLLENSAGAGTTLGSDLGELSQVGEILEAQGYPVGFCLDICHLFAAGYELRDEESYAKTLRHVEETLGSGRVLVLHFNDSKKPLGARVDNHANVGEGEIGEIPFSFWIRDRSWSDRIAILETPGGEDNYRRELLLLKKMRDGAMGEEPIRTSDI